MTSALVHLQPDTLILNAKVRVLQSRSNKNSSALSEPCPERLSALAATCATEKSESISTRSSSQAAR